MLTLSVQQRCAQGSSQFPNRLSLTASGLQEEVGFCLIPNNDAQAVLHLLLPIWSWSKAVYFSTLPYKTKAPGASPANYLYPSRPWRQRTLCAPGSTSESECLSVQELRETSSPPLSILPASSPLTPGSHSSSLPPAFCSLPPLCQRGVDYKSPKPLPSPEPSQVSRHSSIQGPSWRRLSLWPQLFILVVRMV